MAIDRRVQRTRTALFDALVALIRRKDYEAITIEDVLVEADVGRATFYAHFTSKEDLLRRSLDRLRQLLLAARDPGRPSPFTLKPGWSPSRTLFEHVGQFADIRAALAGGRGAPVLRNAIDDVVASVLRDILPPSAGENVPRELAILHVVSTVNTVLRWWLEHRPAMSAAEADRLFARLAFASLPESFCTAFCNAPAPKDAG